jgi:hypothetical protein
MFPQATAPEPERRAAFALLAVSVRQNSEKQQKKTASVLLLFRRQTGQKPRISAANETLLAVNFREKQRKQREPLPELAIVAVFVAGDQCVGDLRDMPALEAGDPELVFARLA